jgi:glycosyltransferase involved in cell wall biosynthesis
MPKMGWIALPVIKAFHRRNKKVIVTVHDVLSNRVTDVGFLRKMTYRAEIKALKNADHIICVSDTDRDIFKVDGIIAEVIPHGIDITQYNPNVGPDDLNQILSKLNIDQFPKRNFCLFVGAFHTPNLEAVRIIRELAKSMKQGAQEETVNFVVVGDCCQPMRYDNFFALGRVDDQMLKALYYAASLVLIPLMKGTGASLKAIEAMAHAKVVLGTPIGLRGYPVESGINCIISDDFTEYKQLITDLLADEDKRRQIGDNARRFAERYDYRTVYKRYIELIKSN